MTDVEEGHCLNCNNDEYIVDWERGTCVCSRCGFVDPNPLMVAGNPFSECHDEEGGALDGACGYEAVRCGAYSESVCDAIAENRKHRRNSCSPPYRRDTYWSERISQWRQLEPEIPSEDAELIERKWEQFTGRYRQPSDPLPKFQDATWERTAGTWNLRCTHMLSKEDCRQLLWAIDEDRARYRLDPSSISWDQQRLYQFAEVDPASLGKPVFVKRYLVSFIFLMCFCSASASLIAVMPAPSHGMHGGVCVHSQP